MKELLQYIVSKIVDEPDKIVINESARNGAILYELSVASDDMGRVIGKNGKTAKAIRDVVKIIAIKEHKKVIVDIV